MIFSVLTNLALGAITTLGALMMTISGLPSGSLLVTGHLMFDPTNNTNIEYVGTQQVVKHTAAGYDFQTNGSQSGVFLLSDGLLRDGLGRGFPCTSTGGTNGIAGYYTTCKVPPLLSTTGSLRGLSLECGNTKVSIVALSGGFIKTAALSNRVLGSSAFTSQFPNFNVNKTVGSGGDILNSTGAFKWNPADTIVLQTSTVIPKTTGVDCRLYPRVVDTYGK